MTIGEKIKEEVWYARKEEREKSLKEGLEQGREEGREETRASDIEKLMQKMNLSREEAEQILA